MQGDRAPETPHNQQLISELMASAESGQIGANDSVLFNDTLMGADEEKLKGVVVGNPVDRNGKIFFEVIAFDGDGPFEIQRRFSEFESLRKAFATRLGGLYIPKLPKSSFFGDSKDVKFLSERSFHLEQFMKKVLRLPYLLQSGELKVFARPDLDLREKDGRVVEISKQLEMLPVQTIEVLAFRMKSVTQYEKY